MHHIQLRRGISLCVFDDCAIVLDVCADRYWRLSRHAGEALARIRDRVARPSDAAQLDRLASLGFVVSGGLARTPTAASRLGSPCQSALDDAAHAPGFNIGLAIEVAQCTIAAHLAVRSLPLHRILQKVAQPKRRFSPVSSDASDLAVTFRRYRRLVPLATLCLPDSLAFLTFARRRGHSLQLVFGVEPDPFSAHCWVQADETVLNDTLDHALVFTPILVV